MNVTSLQNSVANIGAWHRLPFFCQGQFTKVCQRLSLEIRRVHPAAGDILKAFEFVKPCDVRVVILGQDPYPQPGLATGLAFAVPPPTVCRPPSLTNIFDKLRGDICHVNTDCDLTHWAEQGVLLLNATLTVPEGTPDGHRGIGWSPLIRQSLAHLAPQPDIAWFMCGYRASRRLPRNLCGQALRITTGHPSRRHLFTADRPFSCINRFLGPRSINR